MVKCRPAPPAVTPIIETTVVCSLRFNRETGKMAYAHSHAQWRCPSPWQRENLDLGLLLYLRAGTGRTVWHSSRAANAKYCGSCVVVAGSGSADTDPVVAWLVFANLNSQSTRQGPRPGSALEPSVHAGLLGVPRPKAREKDPRPEEKTKNIPEKRVNFGTLLRSIYMCEKGRF